VKNITAISRATSDIMWRKNHSAADGVKKGRV